MVQYVQYVKIISHSNRQLLGLISRIFEAFRRPYQLRTPVNILALRASRHFRSKLDIVACLARNKRGKETEFLVPGVGKETESVARILTGNSNFNFYLVFALEVACNIEISRRAARLNLSGHNLQLTAGYFRDFCIISMRSVLGWI